jgi:hypothetical protein
MGGGSEWDEKKMLIGEGSALRWYHDLCVYGHGDVCEEEEAGICNPPPPNLLSRFPGAILTFFSTPP